jgi:predicted peroxiredoxin
MSKVMVQITSGPEHATKAALGFLIAKAGVDEGHDTTLFLVGDGCHFVKKAVREVISGLGGGTLAEAFDSITSGGGKLYVSKMSLAARGIDESEATGMGGELGTPAILLKLALEMDANLVY